jgi:hypothetical protein
MICSSSALALAMLMWRNYQPSPRPAPQRFSHEPPHGFRPAGLVRLGSGEGVHGRELIGRQAKAYLSCVDSGPAPAPFSRIVYCITHE